MRKKKKPPRTASESQSTDSVLMLDSKANDVSKPKKTVAAKEEKESEATKAVDGMEKGGSGDEAGEARTGARVSTDGTALGDLDDFMGAHEADSSRRHRSSSNYSMASEKSALSESAPLGSEEAKQGGSEGHVVRASRETTAESALGDLGDLEDLEARNARIRAQLEANRPSVLAYKSSGGDRQSCSAEEDSVVAEGSVLGDLEGSVARDTRRGSRVSTATSATSFEESVVSEGLEASSDDSQDSRTSRVSRASSSRVTRGKSRRSLSSSSVASSVSVPSKDSPSKDGASRIGRQSSRDISAPRRAPSAARDKSAARVASRSGRFNSVGTVDSTSPSQEPMSEPLSPREVKEARKGLFGSKKIEKQAEKERKKAMSQAKKEAMAEAKAADKERKARATEEAAQQKEVKKAEQAEQAVAKAAREAEFAEEKRRAEEYKRAIKEQKRALKEEEAARKEEARQAKDEEKRRHKAEAEAAKEEKRAEKAKHIDEEFAALEVGSLGPLNPPSPAPLSSGLYMAGLSERSFLVFSCGALASRPGGLNHHRPSPDLIAPFPQTASLF